MGYPQSMQGRHHRHRSRSVWNRLRHDFLKEMRGYSLASMALYLLLYSLAGLAVVWIIIKIAAS